MKEVSKEELEAWHEALIEIDTLLYDLRNQIYNHLTNSPKSRRKLKEEKKV